MPLMHRLGCFRDDVIFFIYLYQRYAYPVDLTRRNEYGQGSTDEEDAARRARGEVKKGGAGQVVAPPRRKSALVVNRFIVL